MKRRRRKKEGKEEEVPLKLKAVSVLLRTRASSRCLTPSTPIPFAIRSIEEKKEKEEKGMAEDELMIVKREEKERRRGGEEERYPASRGSRGTRSSSESQRSWPLLYHPTPLLHLGEEMK